MSGDPMQWQNVNANCGGGLPQSPVECCIVDWPQQWWPVMQQTVSVPTRLHYHFTPDAERQRLSDEAVERIARRVVELLEEKK